MKLKQEIKEQINNLVFKGRLPVAFYNSEIMEFNSGISKINQKKYIPKYNQLNISRASSNKCISKIYDLF